LAFAANAELAQTVMLNKTAVIVRMLSAAYFVDGQNYHNDLLSREPILHSVIPLMNGLYVDQRKLRLVLRGM
jgi:hypothetical protein